MNYTYTTMIDVIKRIAEVELVYDDDTPRHIRRQLARLTSDEKRKVQDLMDYIEIELREV
jgi:hypothetical protein